MIGHDDAEREFRYMSTAQTFTENEPITDVGARLGWTVVSMANDWDTVFPPRATPPDAERRDDEHRRAAGARRAH